MKVLDGSTESKIKVEFDRDELNQISYAVAQFDDPNGHTLRNNLIRLLWGRNPIESETEKSNLEFELEWSKRSLSIAKNKNDLELIKREEECVKDIERKLENLN